MEFLEGPFPKDCSGTEYHDSSLLVLLLRVILPALGMPRSKHCQRVPVKNEAGLIPGRIAVEGNMTTLKTGQERVPVARSCGMLLPNLLGL